MMHKTPLHNDMSDAKSMAFLKYCNEEQKARVLEVVTCSRYKKGQQIFQEGSIPAGIYCLSSGVVKLVKSNNDGKEQILRFAQQGDYLGYRALIAGEPLIASAICVDECVACFVPKKIFLDLLDSVPLISKEMLKSLSHDLGVVEERVQSMAQKSVRERLAETLLFLHATFSQGNVTDDSVIHISLPREDIANIVGTATETVIRLLSEFRQDKLIDFEGKKIRILNREKLDRISHASV